MSRDDVAVAAATEGVPSIARRQLLKVGAVGCGILVTGGFLGPMKSALAGLAGDRAEAQPDLEVQIFQTAASLENVTIAAYATALELPFISGDATVAKFIDAARQHHAEHRDAFNARAEALGGARQDAPNPKYSGIVEAALPDVRNAAAVVNLGITLEQVAGDTYLADIARLDDPAARALMASVMGVEAQHVAVLRTVAALLAAGVPDLVAVPPDVGRLPASIGSVASPEPFATPDQASPPEEGAVR
jgi:Ferritin-like domain